MTKEEKYQQMLSAESTRELLNLVHKDFPEKLYLGYVFMVCMDSMMVTWVVRERMIWFGETATSYSPEDFSSMAPSGLFAKKVTSSMEAVYPWEYPNLAPPKEEMKRHILFWAENEEEERHYLGEPIPSAVIEHFKFNIPGEWAEHFPEGGVDILLALIKMTCGPHRQFESLSLVQIEELRERQIKGPQKHETVSIINVLTFMGILRIHGVQNTQKYRINPEWSLATSRFICLG